MTAKLPPFALVRVACLDARRSPDHRSELRSQFLLGEVLEVRRASRDRKWWWVRAARDGYLGWVRSWGVVPATRAEAAAWGRRARGRIVAALDEARSEPGTGDLVSPLAWSGRVVLGPGRGGHRRIELPGGRTGWVRAGSVGPASRKPTDLWARVRDFLGAPYLWGGRTPMGIDCSAFAQLLLAEWGVVLPRDAHQQHAATRPLLPSERPRPGDLLFFAEGRGRVAHVGVALADGCYAHARGWVRVNSLEEHSPLYDSGLRRQFRGFRRASTGSIPRVRSWSGDPGPA